MAIITTVVDDFDGTTEAPYTIRFGLDGTLYDIDVSEANNTRVRAFFAELTAVARVVKPGSKAPKRGRRDDPESDEPETPEQPAAPAAEDAPQPAQATPEEPAQLEFDGPGEATGENPWEGPDKKELRNAVRAWAKAAGKEIGERGRIPEDIFKAYMDAHR